MTPLWTIKPKSHTPIRLHQSLQPQLFTIRLADSGHRLNLIAFLGSLFYSTAMTNTKEILLQHAITEFSKYGFAGARVDRIATKAAINKQRIYAYFGNKESLFETVITHVLDDLLVAVAFPSPTLSRQDFLSTYAAAISEYHAQHPYVARLLMWQSLEHDRPVFSTEYYQQKVAKLASHLEIPTQEAQGLLFGVLGMSVWPVMMQGLAEAIYQPSADAQEKHYALQAATSWATQTARLL